MRARDILGLIIAIVGLIVIGVVIDEALAMFPLVASVLGILLLTGTLWMFAFVAAGLAINSYNERIEHYDRNHGDEVGYRGEPPAEIVEKAHQRIAQRVAVKFSLIAVAIFWLLYLVRSYSSRR
jgi:hypothetical protein